jgi:ABC-type Fe3+/spermidine/putrescine transport system ATPase subunit
MTGTAGNTPAVELLAIRKAFAGRPILGGIDLQIAPAEVVVLVGPSGSGKSTLLRIVGGIEQPDSGSVYLSGKDCTSLPAYRRPIHTVFQNYALFPHLDVAGNVAFPLSIAGMPRKTRDERVREALGWVQLEQFSGRSIAGLSGGEKQRVALARALVDRPQCVLLDEPLSALDPHLRAHTLELLRNIQRQLGITYLYITHDRDEALRLADRVGVLNQGRLEQVGTPEEVYKRPATPFVASFLGRMNWMTARVGADGAIQPGTKNGITLPRINGSRVAAPGGRIRIGVRPEDLELTISSTADRGQGVITTRQFSGSETSLRVQADDGTSLLAEIRGDAPGLSPGVRVTIHWKAEATHLFADDHEVLGDLELKKQMEGVS